MKTFEYDALDRLLSAQTTGGSAGDYGPESYTYDPSTGSLASKAGVSYTYGDVLHKHAVTGLSNGSSFSYDANGNMITRTVGGQTFNLSYDAENRMTGVTGAATANFIYNDTGARVIATEGVTTTVYVGSYFEWHGTITDMVKYYYAGTVRVAMRKGEGPALFLLGDHLGSTNRLVHADETPVTPGGMRLYKAWGESRYEPDGELATEYRYTGQFENGYINLYWYGSRWLDPALSRWVQPDQIVPVAQQGTQAWDRFAYVNNSPIRFNDPTGHMVAVDTRENGCSGAGLNCIMDMYSRYDDYEGMDDSIRSYIKRNPDYNPFTDNTLNDSGRWIVANAMFQVEAEKPITLCNCTLDFSYGFLILTFLGGFRGNIGIAVDGNGNLGIIGSFGGGANLFSTVGLGPSLTITNAPKLNRLNGSATQFGGQLGQYKTLGVEYVGFNGYDGLSLSGKNSIQLPFPIEVHATATNSWVFPLNTWR